MVQPRPALRPRRVRPCSGAVLRGLIGLILLAATAAPLRAAELVMFEAPGCTWCAMWHKEIGAIYPKTDESRRAPLRRVNLHDPWPEALKAIRAVTFTPTFVLIDNGQEVDRITGYAGDEFFWYQLSELLKKLPSDAMLPADNAAGAPSPDG